MQIAESIEAGSMETLTYTCCTKIKLHYKTINTL